MHKVIYVFLCAFYMLNGSAESVVNVKDNTDVPITFSTGNYNRLVVRGDKIVEAVFPEKSMGIRRDEQDGSIYVMLATDAPFTLFLTTESGHHVSVTVTGEPSLGKTIELIPQSVVSKVSLKKPVAEPEGIPEPIVSLMSHMEEGATMAGVSVQRLFGKAERLKDGITLLPKEVWQGNSLKGEIIEIYNGGNQRLALNEAWFDKEGVKAIKFSKGQLAPKESALLYRIGELNA